MKRKILVLVAVVTLMAAVTVPAFAADEATVTCTVTVENIAIGTPDPATVPYGVLAVNTSKVSGPISVQNTGTVAETFEIRDNNGTSWTLGDAAGVETYAHHFATDDDTWAAWVALATSYKTLRDSVSMDEFEVFKLQIFMPTSTTEYTEQTTTITILATFAG